MRKLTVLLVVCCACLMPALGTAWAKEKKGSAKSRPPDLLFQASFDRLTAIHVIEHVNDVVRAMEEFHRLVRPGGTVRIETPHYTDFSSFCDPTHKSHLNSFSFRCFGEDHGGFGYYSSAKFREISVRVKLLAFWRWLGFEFLVNRFPRYRRFWEYYLCYVVRGKVMEFEFEVLK